MMAAGEAGEARGGMLPHSCSKRPKKRKAPATKKWRTSPIDIYGVGKKMLKKHI